VSDQLTWLQSHYRSLCNGDWEHQYGFKIETLDNPGWYLIADLADTRMDGVTFTAVEVQRTEDDWVHCRVEAGVFKGAGGPENLVELISIFHKWVEPSPSV